MAPTGRLAERSGAGRVPGQVAVQHPTGSAGDTAKRTTGDPQHVEHGRPPATATCSRRGGRRCRRRCGPGVAPWLPRLPNLVRVPGTPAPAWVRLRLPRCRKPVLPTRSTVMAPASLTAPTSRRGTRTTRDEGRRLRRSLWRASHRPPVGTQRESGRGGGWLVEVPGIEPGSFGAESGLLRAQPACAFLGPSSHTGKLLTGPVAVRFPAWSRDRSRRLSLLADARHRSEGTTGLTACSLLLRQRERRRADWNRRLLVCWAWFSSSSQPSSARFP